MRDDWFGKTDHELWPQEVADKFVQEDRHVLVTGEPICFEETETYTTSGLETRIWLLHKFPIVDEAGRRFVGGISLEITDQKRAEHAWMLQHVPLPTRILRQWLKAGYLEKQTWFPTTSGVPQGGCISPCITNWVLDGLEKTVGRTGWEVFSFVWMPNHIHLFFRTPRPNLSRGVQYLLSGYANWYAKRHRRTGHLFQGRFKGELIEDESYFWNVSRYIHLNPVRGKRPLVEHGLARGQTLFSVYSAILMR